jgi:hypothetical protein
VTRRDLLLWGSAFVGPSAWFADLVVSYALTPDAGVPGDVGHLHVVSLLAFLITAGALAVASSQMRRIPIKKEEDTRDASLQRARFLAVAAVVLCLFSLLLIAGLEIPNWILTPGEEP